MCVTDLTSSAKVTHFNWQGGDGWRLIQYVILGSSLKMMPARGVLGKKFSPRLIG